MIRRTHQRRPTVTEAVECVHCGCATSATAAADGGAYYACPRCGRTWASCYDEAIRRQAGVRIAAAAPDRRDESFDEVKRRLEAWLRHLDEQDPFYVLGVPPSATLDEVRSRFRELALLHHPDRGGDPAQMRRIVRAWDRARVLLATGRLQRSTVRHIAPPPPPEEG